MINKTHPQTGAYTPEGINKVLFEVMKKLNEE